ncbi:MAG: hypothetical protein LKI39_15145 [Bacteroides sp.]|jgi:uncharacterized membrane protein|nr:hypothetical protein [Bacteroides sp.]
MKKKFLLIVIIIFAVIIGFFVNNIAKPYFVMHGIDDYHILSLVYGLMFAVAVDLVAIAFSWGKKSVKNYRVYLLVCPVFGIFYYDIFSLLGILIATAGIFILCKRKWFNAK